MKFLITGGAGFIGSAVIRYLINHTQHSVVNVDKLTYAGNLEALSSVSDSSRYAFEQVDICDAAEIKRVFTEYQPDVVMHLAAESHVDRSISGPAEFIQTNIIGTYVLLEAAREYWGGLEGDKKAGFRFHHVSTDEVYGDLPHPDDNDSDVGAGHRVCPEGSRQSSTRTKALGGELKEQQPTFNTQNSQLNIAELPLFTEQSAYAPSSPYSASKASSDHLVRAWQRTYGLPTLITNCSNNYGPYQFPEKLIPLVILNALAGKSLPIYGDGSQIRDWLYVDDHARALVLVAEQGKLGETYNIGGHNEKRNIEVVETICEVLDELQPLSGDYKSPLQSCASDRSHHEGARAGSIQNPSLKLQHYKDLIVFVEDRPGHDRRYAIDASKIEHDLGWKPVETFESGLRKTVEWYISNYEF